MKQNGWAHFKKQLALAVSDTLVCWGFSLGMDHRTNEEIEAFQGFLRAAHSETRANPPPGRP
jgi:hypothetical protein